MKINVLEIENFRKFEKSSFRFGDSFNIINGKNGAGKTTLLEAIYLLSTGKSFITNHINNCIKFGADYAFVSAEFETKKGTNEIKFMFGKNGKEVRFNGKRLRSFSQFVGTLPAVFMNYKLSLLIKGGPEQRRAFLNHLLIFTDREYYKTLMKYYVLLKERNNLLKNGADAALLSVYNDEIIRSGTEIQKKRAEIIKKISVLTKEMMNFITGERYVVEMEYIKSDVEKLSSSETLEKEILRKRTLFGPHLDDIKILLNNVPAREFSSLGEAYSLAFSMRFAESKIIEEERGEPPVVLLDDFFSDLDEFHRKNILSLTKNRQTLLTTLNLSLVPEEIIKETKVIVLR